MSELYALDSNGDRFQVGDLVEHIVTRELYLRTSLYCEGLSKDKLHAWGACFVRSSDDIANRKATTISPCKVTKFEFVDGGWSDAGDYEDEGRSCRACGCTESDCSQCVERTGTPCHWVESDLCSACAPSPEVQA